MFLPQECFLTSSFAQNAPSSVETRPEPHGTRESVRKNRFFGENWIYFRFSGAKREFLEVRGMGGKCRKNDEKVEKNRIFSNVTKHHQMTGNGEISTYNDIWMHSTRFWVVFGHRYNEILGVETGFRTYWRGLQGRYTGRKF